MSKDAYGRDREFTVEDRQAFFAEYGHHFLTAEDCIRQLARADRDSVKMMLIRELQNDAYDMARMNERPYAP